MKEHSRGQNPKLRGAATAASLMAILFLAILVPLLQVSITPRVMASPDPEPATAAPTNYWGPFFGTSGDVQIDVNQPGIAVRVEIPREFLAGVVTNENDTHFVVSDIRNDYYYYSVVDESKHWSYAWKGIDSDAPCYKPNFSIYDMNAPWCVEIWNYLDGTFNTFSPPKFVRFIGLNSPAVAGVYNFTLFVADHTNSLGLPDFVHAYNKTFFVPVSMVDNPASITGTICDADDHAIPGVCPTIFTKGVVYARTTATPSTPVVARAYVNQTTGFFNLTGLAPGTYLVQGSAGVFHGVAYSLSSTGCSTLQGGNGCAALVGPVNRGDHIIQDLQLIRSPQICGEIDYHNSLTQAALAHSLTDHPYLQNVGIKHLNITVEASDSQHVFRYQNVSLDGPSDTYNIITGQGVKYVGADPYGTEFAGLPGPSASGYTLTVNFYITGYLQNTPVTINVPAGTGHGLCINANVVMQSGGVITGTIELLSSPPTGILNLETPHQAEVTLGLTPTDALFGGNILIRAYDHAGQLRGITVLDGTLPDGRTCYASPALSPLCKIKITSPATIQFYIVGFSEYYNRTWSGTWGEMDYGLPDDQGYRINVQIRGYEQYHTDPVLLLAGSNQTMSIRMVRGGAIGLAVYSYDNRPGTRAIQAGMAFRFAKGLPGGFSIPARGRVYVYDSSNSPVGYIERLIQIGIPCTPLSCGLDAPNFFQGVFAGQNWSLRELWFFRNETGSGLGLEPTHLTGATYSVNGYVLGYVQQGPVSTPVTLGGFARVPIILFLGNEIDLTVPVFMEPSLFGMILEHDHALAQTFAGGSLQGAVDGNLTEGIATLDFPIFGFGAKVQDRTLDGQGHFFYVPRDGNREQFRFKDYGLDLGTYTTQLPEFGFNRHFTTLATHLTTFDDLFLEQGIFLSVISMARIVNAASLVQGWIANNFGRVIPLSWVTVQATNGTINVSVSTLDGRYDGVGAINLPAGIYSITFSVACHGSPCYYASQTVLNYPVYWGADYALLPPFQYLCPLADTSACPAGSFAISLPITLASSSQVGMVQNMQTSTLPAGFLSTLDRAFDRKNN